MSLRLNSVITNEVIIHPNSTEELSSFLARYNGTILNNGIAYEIVENATDDNIINITTGDYLVGIEQSTKIKKLLS